MLLYMCVFICKTNVYSWNTLVVMKIISCCSFSARRAAKDAKDAPTQPAPVRMFSVCLFVYLYVFLGNISICRLSIMYGLLMGMIYPCKYCYHFIYYMVLVQSIIILVLACFENCGRVWNFTFSADSQGNISVISLARNVIHVVNRFEWWVGDIPNR